LQLAAAQRAAHELTAAVRQVVGSAYPVEFFATPVGLAVEALLVPVVLHALTGVVDVPMGNTVRKACELAMTAEAKDRLGAVIDMLVPSLDEIGKRLHAAGVK
jgi:hypothetical protein